jgi:hypothetical protein
VFPGPRQGKPLSPMSLEKVLRRVKAEGATVHGFCSAFRDWTGETTSHVAMIQGFAGRETELFFRGGVCPARWRSVSRVVARKLDMIDAAIMLNDLRAAAAIGLRPERRQGRTVQHSRQ